MILPCLIFVNKRPFFVKTVFISRTLACQMNAPVTGPAGVRGREISWITTREGKSSTRTVQQLSCVLIKQPVGAEPARLRCLSFKAVCVFSAQAATPVPRQPSLIKRAVKSNNYPPHSNICPQQLPLFVPSCSQVGPPSNRPILFGFGFQTSPGQLLPVVQAPGRDDVPRLHQPVVWSALRVACFCQTRSIL